MGVVGVGQGKEACCRKPHPPLWDPGRGHAAGVGDPPRTWLPAEVRALESQVGRGASL